MAKSSDTRKVAPGASRPVVGPVPRTPNSTIKVNSAKPGNYSTPVRSKTASMPVVGAVPRSPGSTVKIRTSPMSTGSVRGGGIAGAGGLFNITNLKK